MPEQPLVHNYIVEQGLSKRLPATITFWDETLRDGEQTPGVHFTPEEKLEIAGLLSSIGVHVIDAGIPVVSPEEHRAVSKVAAAGLDASILAAARAVRKDVEACVECGVDEIAIFIACSDLHLKYKLNMSRDEVLDAAVREVEYAASHGLRVSFVTEDTFRADLDYVARLYNACIEAGAERVVLSDTVGIMTPSGIGWYIGEVRKRFRPVPISVHLHNDFGMATANNLAALEAGAQVPHTCVNGIGERAGNAPFEELVMALEAIYGVSTGIDTSRLYELSRLVERLSGIPIGVNKAIVGYNAFSHESGIHADGVIKHTATYEPIRPERIGRERRFIFGKHTGSTAVRDRLEGHGIDVSKEQLHAIVAGIKELAESRRKEEQIAFIDMFREREETRRGVSDAEFWAIVRNAGVAVPEALG